MRVLARKVLTHSFLYGASTAATVAPGLLLIPLYTRYLSLEDFGAFAVVTTYGSVLLYILDLGLATAFVRRYYTYDKADDCARMRLVSTVFWLMLGTSMLLVGPIYLSAEALSRVFLADYAGATLVRLMTATVFASTLAVVPFSLLRVLEQPGTFFWVSALKGAGLLVVVPVLVVGLGRGVEGIFAGQLVVAVMVAGTGWLLTMRHYSFTFSVVDCRALLGMGLMFWPAMILHWVIDFSDIYFLRHFIGLDEVAVYAVGYKVAQIVFYVVLAFSIGWAPILFGILRDPDPQMVLARLFRVYLLGLVSLFYVLALLTPEIISLLGPESYARAAPVAVVLCAAYVVYGLFAFFLSAIVVTGKFQFQSIALAVGVTVNLSLNLLLIPRYGIGGAAVATLCAFGATAAVGYRFAQRLYEVPYRWREIGCIAAAAGTGYGAYVAVASAGLDGLVLKTGAVLLYLLLLIGLGGVSIRELRDIGKLWAVPVVAT